MISVRLIPPETSEKIVLCLFALEANRLFILERMSSFSAVCGQTTWAILFILQREDVI